MMGTTTQIGSQGSDLFNSDIMNAINTDINEWSNILLEPVEFPIDSKYNVQQIMHPDQYIEQMPLPPPLYNDNPTSNIPSKEEFPGELNFEIILSTDVSGKNCMVSTQLRKVFINMDQTLPIRFKWIPPRNDLILRAMMVYSWDQFRAEPVRRCLNHQGERNLANHNINQAMVDHVVRCTDPRSIYVEHNNHKCILIPLGTPQNGSDYVPLAFQFYCKNSCTSGMNRRCTELVFTLEDSVNRVVGRRILPVRVCSCPKRDKEKEEENPNGAATPSSGKKRKIGQKIPVPPGKRHVHLIPSQLDNRQFDIQVRLLGRENALQTLRAAHGAMSSEATMTGQFAPFAPYLKDIERQIEQLPK